MRSGFRANLDGGKRRAISETQKIAAILVSDMVGYNRLAGADDDRTLSRLRRLRSDLIDPVSSCTIAGSPSTRQRGRAAMTATSDTVI